MKTTVTSDDIAEGRRLLRNSGSGDAADFELFIDWQREHFGVTEELARSTWSRCIQAGDMGRAEGLFDAVAVAYEANPKRNLYSAIARLVLQIGRLALMLIIVLGAIGGVVYLLRGCS